MLLPATEHPLTQTLLQSATSRRIVFMAGLPGVGKSLWVQQLALLAQAHGRTVHLLQWDHARSAFETPHWLALYPEIEGSTQPIIRVAVGQWARQAVGQWAADYPEPAHLLIGEAPLIGNRLIELAQRHDDAAEPLLADPAQTQFLIPVPSRAVRSAIEAARAKSIVAPRHPKESQDAPPNVLQALWHDLYFLANKLGLSADVPMANPAYDPEIYAGVYEHILQHRQTARLVIDEVLRPTGSAYVIDAVASDLQATEQDASAIMTTLEATMTPAELEQAVTNWYQL